MPEILLLCEYATLNGGERSMLATLDGVRAAGFTPVVIAPPDGPLADALAGRGVELLPFCCRTDRGRPRAAEPAARGTGRRRSAVAGRRCCTPTAWRWADCRAPWPPNWQLPSLAHLRDIIRSAPRPSPI